MRTDEDMEIKMTALYALEDMGDEQALEAVISIYDSTTDKKIQSRILGILEDFEQPEAFAKVKDIALNNPDPDLRRRALDVLCSTTIRWFTVMPTEYASTPSAARRKDAIMILPVSYLAAKERPLLRSAGSGVKQTGAGRVDVILSK